MSKVPIYTIDSGVPAPNDGVPTRERVPIGQLEVGESILFPKELRPAVIGLAHRLKKSESKKFTVKKMDDNNSRVWRVE